MTPPAPDAPPGTATRLASLHVPQDGAGLDRVLSEHLAGLLGEHPAAVLCYLEEPRLVEVRAVVGNGCPLTPGGTHDPADWDHDGLLRLPLRYADRDLRELRTPSPLAEPLLRELSDLLAHYATALVNQTLNADARDQAEHYCASLMALEEGVALFQEGDTESVTARFLGLATTMMKAPAGALYVLDSVGDPDSPLRLVQSLGMPEDLLAGFHNDDGSAWPRSLLTQPARHLDRNDDPTLGGLSGASVPEVLQSLAHLPLHYHGVVAGLCLLFNAAPERGAEIQLDRLRSLGSLGAALLHRLSLEQDNLRTQALDTQLTIAANIQSRLQPVEAPDTPAVRCAWRTRAAQNIGGDYLDLLRTEDGEVIAAIADASGHGIDSALLMTSFRSSFRAKAPWMGTEEVLGSLNDEVGYEVGGTGMFITAAAARITPDGRSLEFASAGHNPCYLYRAATGTIEELDGDGPPLGFMAGIDYGVRRHDLAPGDVLLLYTDGIVEAARSDGEMFGEERLRRCLIDHAAASAERILAAVLDAVGGFTDHAPQEDDISLSVLEILPAPPPSPR